MTRSEQVFRRPSALADLSDIWDYIGVDNPEAADRLLRKLASSSDMLAEHPLAGRSRPDLSPGLRSFPVGRYVIFYQASPSGIEVVRVLHGPLDIETQDFA